MRGRVRRNVYYLILFAALLAIIFASYRSLNAATAPAERPLSDLLTALDGKQVVHGTFNSADDRVDWSDDQGRAYRTFYPPGYEATLVDRFQLSKVSFDARPPASSSLWLSVVLPNAILILVIGGFLWLMLRRFGGRQPPTA